MLEAITEDLLILNFKSSTADIDPSNYKRREMRGVGGGGRGGE